MKRLLLSTAVAGLLGTAAVAQTAPMGTNDTFIAERLTDAIYASELIGKSVYVDENDVTETSMTDASTDWDRVGEVKDVLLSRSGEVDGILVDVGGFLGIGERTVAVDMDALRLVTDSDTAGDYFVVFRSDRAALEAAPEYDFPETMAAQSVAPGAATTTATDIGTAAGTTTNNMAATTGAAVGGAAASVGNWMDPTEGYARVERAAITTEQLTGANVYDANNEDVGRVSELVVGPQGEIQGAVVDVGGFLGIGAKPVALDYNQLDVHKQVDGDTLRVYVNMTKEQLEALPAHSES